MESSFPNPSSRRSDRSQVGILLISGAVIYLLYKVFVGGMPPDGGARMDWKPYSSEALEQARLEAKPVMIDFYADWCGPCHLLDRAVFSQPEVADASRAWVCLRVDATHQNDPSVRPLLEAYFIQAFPSVLFFGKDGQERRILRLMGVESKERFLGRMRAVTGEE